jgi:hypothetical protein
MSTLHIAPGYSAGGSLIQALQNIHSQDEVLRWPDDLSCGPINTSQNAQRAAWWEYDVDVWDLETLLDEFWARVFKSEDRLVVWFSRHSASEYTFFLNWAEHLGSLGYYIIDSTVKRIPSFEDNGDAGMTELSKAISRLGPDALMSLLGSERKLTNLEEEQASKRWRQLKAENAPFRIVTVDGLVSAPLEHFDPWLLGEASQDWRSMARLVGGALRRIEEPYRQTSDITLSNRVFDLVEAGQLVSEGNPSDMHDYRVRLPD